MGLANVRFLPPVPKTQMGEALAAADACIAILKPVAMYRTVYPNKVFDYMAAGRPTILAIDGVIREVLEAAVGGFYVPPGDDAALAEAIAVLAANPELAVQKGARPPRREAERAPDRPMDPDSPFAALAALKDRLGEKKT